jgi:hypothetical protein
LQSFDQSEEVSSEPLLEETRNSPKKQTNITLESMIIIRVNWSWQLTAVIDGIGFGGKICLADVCRRARKCTREGMY